MTALAELGAPIGTGNVAEVFAYGDGVLKLYRSGIGRENPEREAEVLRWLAGKDLPVPQGRGVIDVDGRFGLVMSRAPGGSFAEAMLKPNADPGYLRALAELHRTIHAVPGAGLVPLKERMAARIARAAAIDARRRDELAAALAGMPAGGRLCHGDFHPFNVLGTPEEAVVIDWLDATSGDPAADLCRSYVLLRPINAEFAEAYVAAYLAASAVTRDAMNAWLPLVAAARLAETLPPGQAGLLLEMTSG